MEHSNEKNTFEWVHCNSCLRETRHDTVASRTVCEKDVIDDDESPFVIHWETTYTMLECRGCSTATLRRHSHSHELGQQSEEYYPPKVSRKAPHWRFDLPADMRFLLDETYTVKWLDHPGHTTSSSFEG